MQGCDFLFKIIRRNIFIIVIIPVVVFLFIFMKMRKPSESFTTDRLQQSEQYYDDTNNEEELEQNNSELLIVDIKGAVKRPGVYEHTDGDRVNDLIEKAGGFLETADESQVNLAQKLQDEMSVIVPDESEFDELAATATQTEEDIVKANYATAEEFATLPGIGPSKAQAIVDYRDEHGFFTNTNDLLNISGIGEKTLENIEEYLQIP